MEVGERRLTSAVEQSLQSRLEQENENFEPIRQQAYTDYLPRVELDKLEYQNADEVKEKAWDSEEKYRERLRNAIESQDLEVLTQLLTDEIYNEITPIPLIFDIEFVNVNSVHSLDRL